MAGTSLGTAYVQIMPKATGIKGSISSALSGEASAAGNTAGTNIAGKIKGALAKAAIGATVGMILKKALDEGGKLQQSYGGLETIYGKASGAAKKYAAEAVKAGISANDYAEQAVSFGASLKQAFGGNTTKAVKAANTAILDMTDNAAKMGTPIEDIQRAYQGFARGQYGMLDNLKLGYGGTKSEMERLLADAEKLTGVHYDMNNLGDVYSAIHAIQGELGLTGVAAAEAGSTLSGSFGAMKAAYSNFMGSMALGEDIKGPLTTLIQTASTFLFGNLIPMVGNVVKALPSAIMTAIQVGIPSFMAAGQSMLANIMNGMRYGLPQFAAQLPVMLGNALNAITAVLPSVLSKGRQIVVSLANGFLSNLPAFINSLTAMISKFTAFISKNLPTIVREGGKMIKQLAVGFIRNLPSIIAALAKLAATVIKSVAKLAPKLLSLGAKAIFGLAKGMGGAALSAVKTALSKIATAITQPIEKAKEKVKGIMNKIKGIFPLHIGRIFSGLQLPHISVSGGSPPFGIGGKGSLPSFSVHWNKEGAIFDKATILQGVGEAGPEAVIPLDKFWSKMDRIAEASEASGGNTVIVNVYGVTDTNIVKKVTDSVEKALAKKQKQRNKVWA